MRKPSTTYRFFCALTALVVFLGTGIPAEAHTGILAELCNMDVPEHHDSHMSEGEHCDLPTHHGNANHSNHTAPTTDKGKDDCPPDHSCICSVDDPAARTPVVISSFKTFNIYVPVTVEILDNVVFQEHPNPTKQVFASLYSPPLFLKNSSFLN